MIDPKRAIDYLQSYLRGTVVALMRCYGLCSLPAEAHHSDCCYNRTCCWGFVGLWGFSLLSAVWMVVRLVELLIGHLRAETYSCYRSCTFPFY